MQKRASPGSSKPLPSAVFLILQIFALYILPARAQEENKVVVRDFNWRVYSTEHFDIHYYGDSKPWLDYAAQTLEAAYKRESADLNPSLSKRLPFFLYSSINDMEQTGIADVSDGVGGLTEPFKDRFMVWSDGSKGWLKDVMEHELTHEMQFSVLIDGFWKSARILKTFVYPSWMMEGMAEYETGGLDLAVEEMYTRDAALSGGLIPLWRLNQFGHLKPHQVTLAYKTGARAMRFLASQYGSEKPRKMLELFRTRYEASSVLQPLIGIDIFAFDKKFREYEELNYLSQAQKERLSEPEIYGKKLTSGSGGIPEFNVSPALSPDSTKLAYISTRYGQPPSVFIKDLSSGKEKRLNPFTSGIENIPYGRFTKPLRNLAWSPDGTCLVFSGQKNHREYLYFYRTSDGRITRSAMEGLQEARQPVFSPDGSRLAFVGMRGGFNDLYEVNAARAEKGNVPYTELKRLTESPQDEDSPAYAPDGSGLAYSCEVDAPEGQKRDLCFYSDGRLKDLLSMDGSIYDPVFSTDSKKIFFVSDAGNIFDLYQLEPASGKALRLTRSMGGNFTPSPDSGGRLYFSGFRKGNMNIYSGDARNFLYEPVFSAAAVQSPDSKAPLQALGGTDKPYKFSASTDLFFPAFIFSSPGGLYLMNYWQASDMLGRHNLSLYASYNSGADFLNYQTAYGYSRWRMPLTAAASGENSHDNTSSDGLNFNKRSSQQSVGTAWPFNRYNRVEFTVVNKNETDTYTDIVKADRLRTRAFQVSYVRDTVNGLYLTAVSGSLAKAGYVKAVEKFGGNLQYDAYVLEYLKYFPLSKRSTFVNRFVAAESTGRDRWTFDFGGLGGVRGYSSSASRYDTPVTFINNAEFRVPLSGDMNYYMWYMFPDFYFKAVYGKVFMDSACGWTDPSMARFPKSREIRNSVGVGIDIHTFILQTFQLVLSFDYARRTTDGGKIFYVYLGPLF
ncbi:MAG: hypothetical protein NTX59_00270 [Elusimicrobia bacterium]|nr:hypothetical protein [Elusimicrobiota bacterium]